MEIKKCQRKKMQGWKCDGGYCYVGKLAKQRAIKQWHRMQIVNRKEAIQESTQENQGESGAGLQVDVGVEINI